MTDAILGTIATLPGLDGDVEVEVKAGTQSADIVTVKERGITRLRGGGRGELKIGIQVVTPVRLNSKESAADQAVRRKPPAGAARVLDLPAGLVREAAGSVPRRLIAGSSSWRLCISFPRFRFRMPWPATSCASRATRPGMRSPSPECAWESTSPSATAPGSIVEGTVTSIAGGELVGDGRARAPGGAAPPELWLAQALAKGDRDELAVQAATELGRERRDPVGGGALRVAVGGREGGTRPGALGGDRAGGEQAGDPGVGSRGGGARDDGGAGRAAGHSCSCSSPRHPEPSPRSRSTSTTASPSWSDPRAAISAELEPGDAGATHVRLGPEVLRTSTRRSGRARRAERPPRALVSRAP